MSGFAGELDLVAGTFDRGAGGADTFGHVIADGVEAGVVAAGDDQFREVCGRQFGQGQVGVPDRPPTAQCRHERDSGGEEVGRKLVGIAADRLQEADDPLIVGKVQVPDATNGVDE